MLENIFQAVLVMSGMGILLGGVLLALKPLLQKKFSAGWCYYIWLVVLVAMVLPVKVNWTAIRELEVVVAVSQWAEKVLPIEGIRDAGEWLQEIRQNGVEFLNTDRILTDEEGHRLVSSHLQERRIREIAFERNLAWLSRTWLVGAVICLVLRLLGYGDFLWRIRRNTEQCELPQVKEYTKRRVRVRRGECIYSPMLFGVFRPVLLLPNREFPDEQLHYVLSHEMTHLRRNDMLVKWFMMMIKCLHWFNPAVYFIDRQLEQECEISCDIAVTVRMSGVQKKSYADTILTFLMGQKKREFSLSMGMAGTKGLLKKRFLRMKSAVPTSRKVKVLSGLLTFVLVTGAVAVGNNLMNRTFPYEGDRTIFGVVIPDCEKCQVRTRYMCWVETLIYSEIDGGKSSGLYKRFIFQCPKCLEQEWELRFLRDLTDAEWERYRLLQEKSGVY